MTASASLPQVLTLSSMLDRAVRDGATPAAQACVIERGVVAHASAHGADHEGRAVTLETLFDVASVTKAAATTLAAAVLLARRAFALDERVARLVPGFTGGGRETVTIRELLAHASGLPAWEPYFALACDDAEARTVFTDAPAHDFGRARALVLEACLQAPITGDRGARVYSDIGFMVLGLALEAAAGAPLDRLCHDVVWGPLGLEHTGYSNLLAPAGAPFSVARRHVAPTGRCRPREPAPGQEAIYAVPAWASTRVAPGEVDDDNAFALGGVSGHAGVFSTAGDLARLGWGVAEEIEGAGRLGPDVGAVLAAFSRHDAATRGPARGLGFDHPARAGSLVGSLLGRAGPRGAVGHFGFTGCSLWVDLDRSLSVSLLTNRTFAPPGRANVDGIRALRPAFHDAVVRELGVP